MSRRGQPLRLFFVCMQQASLPVLYKASKIVPRLNVAIGRDLFAPVEFIDNGELLARDGKIEAIGRHLHKPFDCEVCDLGDAILLPPFVNSHTHLQLSWLAGKTVWKEGFATWLKSMVPQILGTEFAVKQKLALKEALCQLAGSGVVYVGDIGGNIPGTILEIAQQRRQYGLEISHFCEWIGFGNTDASPWPPRCRADLAATLPIRAIPCGHALYSTSAPIMRQSHAWCKANGYKFTFHLAESPDETEMLTTGQGALADFYRGNILPPGWQPPGLSPFRYAQQLDLLGPETLLVHGVTMNSRELESLAASGAALCICARSNSNLGVGSPPVKTAAEAGILLCLGTDGLSSCSDLDLRNEADYIHQNLDMPLNALWRMASANGAAALGYSIPDLLPGSPARFTIWADGHRTDQRLNASAV